MTDPRDHPPEEQLSQLFSYRAEWLGEKLFELFTEPSFLPELKTSRPCMLVGGRGTGKTTILKCLAYEGQYALSGPERRDVSQWAFYGLYYRVNTNRVNAFSGPELDERGWIRHFAHYVNLEFCDLLLQFLSWYGVHNSSASVLSPAACRALAVSLNLPDVESLNELLDELGFARLRFEAALNNIADEGTISGLSMQGAPIDLLIAHIRKMPEFRGKVFYFLVDEYENYLPYQQQVLNTLIKHTAESQGYTFKIGIRELGLRRRTTLNPDEQLISPADYVLISITEKLGDRFAEFAERVCNERLKRLTAGTAEYPVQVRPLFPPLSERDEAVLLGVDKRVQAARESLVESGAATEARLKIFDALDPFFAYFFAYRAGGSGQEIAKLLDSYPQNPKYWQEAFGNYSHVLLYTINRGKRGIHKYYAGWNVMTRLASGNIRYLLELVDTTLMIQLRKGGDLSAPISPRIQTESAQGVGRKNLTELDGLSIHGAKLTKLLLGLGRVFQVMAADPEGHTPEANHFEVVGSGDEGIDSQVDDLLQSAVRHLALVRFTGSKPQEEGDTKAYDYMVHPIFCPFFEFSYRRKRKITIRSTEVLGLVTSPSATIGELLRGQNRDVEQFLPEQLRLFEGFYAGGS